VLRRPTVARNRRRSAASIDRSSTCASIARKNFSFSIAVFTDAAVASTAGAVSHARRVIPNPTSNLSSRSRSAITCSVSRCATFWCVNAVAVVLAEATICVRVTAPGRTVRAAIRYSHARLNSVVGESCSIARPSRNSSSSLTATPSDPAGFQDR
jgi:hypothetical protein